MRSFHFIAIGALGLGLQPAASACWASDRARAAPSATPVVVELFSSEGCSSCPPADEFLAQLDHEGAVDGVPVIALEEHVDYWDDLGWRDPFGSAAFSARQERYARVLSDHRVFTPELVVDGQVIFGTRDARGAKHVLANAAAQAKAEVKLKRRGSSAQIEVSQLPARTEGDEAEIWLALTERDISSQVTRGENAGRRLRHGPIVRQLKRIATLQSPKLQLETKVELDPRWNANAVRVVVLVQLSQSRRIVGAAID